MILQEKLMILTPSQKLLNNVGNLGKKIVVTSFECLPKVQKNCPIWSHCSDPLMSEAAEAGLPTLPRPQP